MKTILAIDTATEACSVALLYEGNITTISELSPRTHTQRILPMIDELLNQSNITLKQIELLAFGRGPGSFTGVRVGVGIAQGLAFGGNLPVVPVSNLLMMAEQAYQQFGKTEVIALIDARMNEVYFAQFSRNTSEWTTIVTEQVCSPICAIKQFKLENNPTIVGTGWLAYSQFSELNPTIQPNEITLPSAEFMLPLAMNEAKIGNIHSVLDIEPVYLRNEVTWKKLPNKV